MYTIKDAARDSARGLKAYRTRKVRRFAIVRMIIGAYRFLRYSVAWAVKTALYSVVMVTAMPLMFLGFSYDGVKNVVSKLSGNAVSIILGAGFISSHLYA